MNDKLPSYLDRVKSKVGDATGIVMAVFPSNINSDEILLDIRLDDDAIYYNAKAAKWEVIEEYKGD